jgi:hypothetical protein
MLTFVPQGSPRGTSAYYGASVAEFLAAPQEAIIGRLTLADPHRALDATQKQAWAEEIRILHDALVGLDAALFLEFDVPRLGSRIDAVLIAGAAVFPIEFKCGEKQFTTAAYNQAWDYGLDLKNFHLASHTADIYPILVATRADAGHEDKAWEKAHRDGVRPPRRVAPAELRMAIDQALLEVDGPALDADGWGRSPWAVIVCLVGGGQEIHTGEAGIAAWLEAVVQSFSHWQTYVSPNLSGSEYDADAAIATLSSSDHLVQDARLHLSTSMRSFRSEKVSSFVKALLDSDESAARDLLREVLPKYSIVATRDLARAKQWIREQARGSEQYGLIASAQARRLKPHAIDVRVSVDPIRWFLGKHGDTRSSYYLEDAATEFQVQGLEVDWACVTWDADRRLIEGAWRYHTFKGVRWNKVKKRDRQRYLLNAYRVLLTRARQGMAIFVPPGDSKDPTRLPQFYDETFSYLRGVGVPVL